MSNFEFDWGADEISEELCEWDSTDDLLEVDEGSGVTIIGLLGSAAASGVWATVLFPRKGNFVYLFGLHGSLLSPEESPEEDRSRCRVEDLLNFRPRKLKSPPLPLELLFIVLLPMMPPSDAGGLLLLLLPQLLDKLLWSEKIFGEMGPEFMFSFKWQSTTLVESIEFSTSSVRLSKLFVLKLGLLLAFDLSCRGDGMSSLLCFETVVFVVVELMSSLGWELVSSVSIYNYKIFKTFFTASKLKAYFS